MSMNIVLGSYICPGHGQLHDREQTRNKEVGAFWYWKLRGYWTRHLNGKFEKGITKANRFLNCQQSIQNRPLWPVVYLKKLNIEELRIDLCLAVNGFKCGKSAIKNSFKIFFLRNKVIGNQSGGIISNSLSYMHVPGRRSLSFSYMRHSSSISQNWSGSTNLCDLYTKRKKITIQYKVTIYKENIFLQYRLHLKTTTKTEMLYF